MSPNAATGPTTKRNQSGPSPSRTTAANPRGTANRHRRCAPESSASHQGRAPADSFSNFSWSASSSARATRAAMSPLTLRSACTAAQIASRVISGVASRSNRGASRLSSSHVTASRSARTPRSSNRKKGARSLHPPAPATRWGSRSATHRATEVNASQNAASMHSPAAPTTSCPAVASRLNAPHSSSPTAARTRSASSSRARASSAAFSRASSIRSGSEGRGIPPATVTGT